MQHPTRRFALRLALQLGYANVNRMLDELTSEQLSEWIAYSRLEPFGSWVEDLRTGIVASTVANFAGKSLKKDYVASPREFMQQWERATEERLPSKDIKSVMTMWAAAGFGKIETKERG